MVEALVLAESLPVPLTVIVYRPGVVPVGWQFAPHPPELPPPQLEIAGIATVSMIEAINDLHLRRILGEMASMTRAKSASPPTFDNGPGFPTNGTARDTFGAVVPTDTLAVPFVEVEESVTGEVALQVGWSIAPEGKEVMLHARLIVPL